MAFVMKLSPRLCRSPPLLHRCYMAAAGGAASSVAKAVTSVISKKLLCGSMVEEQEEEKRRFTTPSPRLPATSLSLSLSLGPNSPRNHYELIDDDWLSLSTNNAVSLPEVVFDGEEISSINNKKQSNVVVVTKKKNIDEEEEITTLSLSLGPRNHYELVSEEISYSHSNAEKKIDQEIISKSSSSSCLPLFPDQRKRIAAVEILEDSFKPLKKRESVLLLCGGFNYNNSNVVDNKKKKRKRAEEEIDDCWKPLKKRAASFVGVDNDNDNDVFKMRKKLKQSDVNNLSRLLLGNNEMIDKLVSNLNLTEECFKDPKHGKKIKIYDLDIKKESSLVLKRWVTNSFILNGGWSQKFVKARSLKKDDVIELQWDQTKKRLNFSVFKRALPPVVVAAASSSVDEAGIDKHQN